MKRDLFNKFFFLLGFVGLDALTKVLALRWIPPFQGSNYPFGGIGIFENFCGVACTLSTAGNTGVAWGLFPNHLNLLMGLRLCIIAGLLIHLLFFRSKHLTQYPLWLIAAGAIGNIIDMFVYGTVIDFIHFRFFDWSFPIFNVADSCITIGVACLLLWPKRPSAVHHQQVSS